MEVSDQSAIENQKSKIGGGMKHIVGPLVIFVTMSVCGAAVQAQQPTKTYKIAVLVSGTEALNKSRDEALRQGLREHGYEEGKNIVFEYKYAEGKTDRLPQLARELVEQKPDVIVVGGTQVATAAKNATSTIPIVVAGAAALVEAGAFLNFFFSAGDPTP